MAASLSPLSWPRSTFAIAVVIFVAAPAQAQLLPWETNIAEVESGRIRALAQRLNKQNLLYQLHLGDVRKEALVETAEEIDLVIATLENGNSAHSIPAAWTPELRERLKVVDSHWRPLRRIAVASAEESFRVSRQLLRREQRRADPLLLRYFDDLTVELVDASQELINAYHAECKKSGFEVCETSYASGYAAMVIERAALEAVNIIADIRPDEHRKKLETTIEAYQQLRRDNQQSAFFAAALDPERGISARAAGQLLASLRADWDSMQVQMRMLNAGDPENFDIRAMLAIHTRLVSKVERMTAALVRYASLAYGS
jgi:hypothetical protein